MTDLNTQYNEWLEKRNGLFAKWENEISPPPAQESENDFREIERHPRRLAKSGRPYPVQTGSGFLPSWDKKQSRMSEALGENSSPKQSKRFEERINGQSTKGPYDVEFNQGRITPKPFKKGRRGPKKGAHYHKLGAKDDFEEKDVTQETTPAMRDYYRNRNPENYKKVVSEFRSREPKETNWGAWGTDIKGFHHEPLKFAHMLKRLRKAVYGPSDHPKVKGWYPRGTKPAGNKPSTWKYDMPPKKKIMKGGPGSGRKKDTSFSGLYHSTNQGSTHGHLIHTGKGWSQEANQHAHASGEKPHWHPNKLPKPKKKPGEMSEAQRQYYVDQAFGPNPSV